MTFDQAAHLSSLLAAFRRDAYTRAGDALEAGDHVEHARLFDSVLLVDALASRVRYLRATLENRK